MPDSSKPWSSSRVSTIDRADLAQCSALLRGGSRTFFAASLLLPPGVRAPATALYAFCRVADDAVDLGASPGAIGQLRDRLDRAYAGQPANLATDRAFAATVARFDIPRTLPEALIEGFTWDSAGRFYDTLADLNGYGARVAGSVGAMMALIMGVQAPEIVARACDLGMAMQLSNIARDVGEDARAGRLYLPLKWLREVGIDPESWLARPSFTPELGFVIHRLLRAADRLYARSEVGIARLPASCRPGIRAARFLYAEIGREVERRGCDSVSLRAVTPLARKLQVLAGSLAGPALDANALRAPVEEGARFLIDAVSGRTQSIANPLDLSRRTGSRWKPADRIAWLIDLFERLEKRDRLRMSDRRRPALDGPDLDGQPAL
jgi:phytoene synthase